MIDNYYEDKKEYSKIGNNRRRSLLQLIQPTTGQVVLDVGCGQGHLGRLLKDQAGVIVYGVDISSSAIKIATPVLDGAYVVDLEEPDWPPEILDQHYDVIVIPEVLEHLFRPEELLAKVAQLASPRTKIIITVPNVLFWKNRFKMLLGHFDYTESGLMDRGHIHFFTWSSLRTTLKRAGLSVMVTAHNCPTRGTRYLGRWWPGLFAYQLIISSVRYE